MKKKSKKKSTRAKKVQPITDYEDINLIKRLLKDQPRNLALFTLGINTNLRASDLLRLKVYHMQNVEPGDHLEIKEKKTEKNRKVTLNETCVRAIWNLLDNVNYSPGDFLFKTRKSDVMIVSSVHRLVKSWCRAIGLEGNYGSHTLRKTWGYHQRVTFKVDIPTLMVCFNHSTQKQTLDYLCIQPEEIRNVYNHEL